MTAKRLSEGRRFLSRLATLDRRLARIRAEEAEILTERAALFAEQAGEEQVVDLATATRLRRDPTPPAQLIAPTELDRARAERALQNSSRRRRSAAR